MAMFQDASQAKSKLRAALCGVTGSGKSMTAYLTARGLVGPHGRIAVLDTERGSFRKSVPPGSKFADVQLANFSPVNYIKMIESADAEGFDVLIIDSLSHEWFGPGGCLDLVEQAKKRTKNQFTAWADVTPLHNKLIGAIISASCHVIATMRVKAEFVIENDANTGGTKPKKVGLGPIQRDGMDYEFDLLGDVDASHNVFISKCRAIFGDLDGQTIHRPGVEFGEMLRDRLDGIEATVPSLPKALDARLARRIEALVARLGMTGDQLSSALAKRRASTVAQLGEADAEELIGRLEEKVEQAAARDREEAKVSQAAEDFGAMLDAGHAEVAAQGKAIGEAPSVTDGAASSPDASADHDHDPEIPAATKPPKKSQQPATAGV